MANSISKLRLFFASLLLGTLLPLVAGGQVARMQEGQGDEPKYNIVLLIDESGSMWCDDCNDTEAPLYENAPKANDWLPIYDNPPMRIKAVEGLLTNMAVEPKITNFSVGIVSFHNTTTRVVDLQPVGDQANLIGMMRALYNNHGRIYEQWKTSASTGLLQTNTPDALRQAYDMLFTDNGVARAQGKNVVIMISDGVPELDGRNKQELQTGAVGQVQRLTAAKAEFISLLIFNPNAKSYAQVAQEDRKFWSDIAKGPGLNQACDYREVNNSRLLFQSTQTILRCILTGNTSPPPVYAVKQGEPQTFAVENFIKEISITIRKNSPNTVVRVLRPGSSQPLTTCESCNDAGDTVRYTKVGSSESYVVSHPPGGTSLWTGCWTVTVETADAADLKVPVEFVPVAYAADYNVNFERPDARVWPVGKPMTVEVNIADSTNQIVQLDIPMSLGVDRPNGSETRTLQAQGQSFVDSYTATERGTYTFTASINASDLLKPTTSGCPSILQGQPGQIANQRPVEMELQPWIKLNSPGPNEEVKSTDFKAEAQILLGTEGATDADLVEGDVKAQLVRKGENRPKTFVLERVSQEGVYSGQPFDVNTLKDGDYTLTVSFNGKIANNTAIFTDTAQVDFKLVQVIPPTTTPAPVPTDTPNPPTATEVLPTSTVEPTPSPTPLPPCPDGQVRNEQGDCAPPPPPPDPPWLVLGVLGTLLTGGLIFLALWAVRGGARMDGLRLDPSGMGAPIQLRNKQATVRLGSANLQFAATSPSGLPMMTVASAASPVMVNGNPYNQGDKTTLNPNDIISVDGETYTLGGMPRAKRGAKTNYIEDEYQPFSSDDYPA